MHAKEVSRIWLTSDHCESRFMRDDNAPTQNAGQTLLASTRCSVADALIWLWPKTFGGVNRKQSDAFRAAGNTRVHCARRTLSAV
jgi:hypothetical protein